MNEGVPGHELKRWMNAMRLTTYGFIISTALFCLVVLTVPSNRDAAPVPGYWGLLPLSGILLIFAAVQIPKQIQKSEWFVKQKGTGRLRAGFLLSVLKLVLLESAIVPAILYFLVTGAAIWVLLSGGAGIVVMFLTMKEGAGHISSITSFTE